MEQLIEKIFTGTWKSYKAFRHSGEVKVHTKSFYQQYTFEDSKLLTITNYNNGSYEKLVQTENWNITFKNRRHYINLKDSRQTYEIITINHVAMVLMNPTTHEKYFFARPATWETYVKSNPALVL